VSTRTRSPRSKKLGSCTQALRLLTDLGLLGALALRGRFSGCQVTDPDRLLEAYASAAEQAPTLRSLQVGVTGRDPVAGLAETGQRCNKANLARATTGRGTSAGGDPWRMNPLRS